MTNEIHDLCRLHPLSQSSNYITCLADVSIFDNCIPQRQLVSYSVTRPFLSLRRVWFVRLIVAHAHICMVSQHDCIAKLSGSKTVHLSGFIVDTQHLCNEASNCQLITKVTSFTGLEGSGSPTSIELLPCWGDQSDSCSSWTLASHNQLTLQCELMKPHICYICRE